MGDIAMGIRGSANNNTSESGAQDSGAKVSEPDDGATPVSQSTETETLVCNTDSVLEDENRDARKHKEHEDDENGSDDDCSISSSDSSSNSTSSHGSDSDSSDSSEAASTPERGLRRLLHRLRMLRQMPADMLKAPPTANQRFRERLVQLEADWQFHCLWNRRLGRRRPRLCGVRAFADERELLRAITSRNGDENPDERTGVPDMDLGDTTW